ncbi:hypothetical protein [Evansella tamaricis]|nr:hypothetical protein [Evansella tamaricis]
MGRFLGMEIDGDINLEKVCGVVMQGMKNEIDLKSLKTFFINYKM